MPKIIKTEWFDHITTDDLNDQESFNSMIMYCKHCKAFFNQKACGGRSIFQTNTIFHPTDGNTIIMGHSDPGFAIRFKAHECEHYPVRITTLKDLNAAIEHFNFYNHEVK